MAKKRIARVNEQIRRELTSLLQRDVRDPRIGNITVTAVETSPDLYHAKVFYSVMGSDDDRASAAEGLRAAAGFLRTEIGRRMHIRRAPELHFTYDDTLQHAMHIERLLQEARASSGGTDESSAPASTDTDSADPSPEAGRGDPSGEAYSGEPSTDPYSDAPPAGPYSDAPSSNDDSNDADVPHNGEHGRT